VEIKARLDKSFQQVTTKPLMYNALQYAEFSNQAGVNDGLGPFSQFSEDIVSHYRTGDSPELYPSNNWYDKYFKDFASMQRLGVNITGGNDKVTYFSNLNFMHQGGYFNTESKDYDANPKNIWVNYRSNVAIQFNNYLIFYNEISSFYTYFNVFIIYRLILFRLKLQTRSMQFDRKTSLIYFFLKPITQSIMNLHRTSNAGVC